MFDLKIKIPYGPKAKGSVRQARERFYNPSARGMKKLRQYVIANLPTFPEFPLNGPLLVIVHFCIPSPLSLPNSKREAQHLLPHTKKPDGDNLEKFVNDALNGVVWTDDCNIIWLLRSKTLTYDKVGSISLYVKLLDKDKPNYEEITSHINEAIQIDG